MLQEKHMMCYVLMSIKNFLVHNDYDAIEKLNEKTGVAVPKPLVGIKDREVLHKTHIDKTEIINFIKSEMEGL